MKKEVKKLHPHEQKVLKALDKLKKASASDIAKHAELPESSVHKAAMWSHVKGYVRHEESKHTKATVTAEGKKYVKEGLPEKRLIKEVHRKPKKLNEINGIENLNIALSWANKKGWISIKQGVISITPEGEKFIDEETILEKSLRMGNLDNPEILSELKKRSLVEVKETKEKTYYLTPEGEKLIPFLEIDKDVIAQLTPDLIKGRKWEKMKFRGYDVNDPVPTTIPAKVHPYIQFINKIRSKLISLGFVEVRKGFVETTFWNFDSLFIPQDHPARGAHDAFEIKNPSNPGLPSKNIVDKVSKTHLNGWITGSIGWGRWDIKESKKLVLRTHTTPVSARTLASVSGGTGKYFTIDRNFRSDVIDASHSIEFNQCEGIVISEGLGLKHLLGYMKEIANSIGIKEIKFKPGYFPFTEPSVEGFIKHPKLGWIEALAAGILRPEVTRPLGINEPVLAWGLGIDRLAMAALDIKDIRELFSHDLGFLREKGMVI